MKIDKVKILWTDDRWDGPLSGLCMVNDSLLYFSVSEDREFDQETEEETLREFNLYLLTEKQFKWKLYWHNEFCKYVADYDYKRRSEDCLKPYSEHNKFYDRYDKVKNEFKLSDSQIVGSFDESQIEES